MPVDDGEDAIRQWANFSVEHLPEIKDLELATLKVHLVVEGCLRYLLSARLQLGKKKLRDIRFAQVAELALGGLDNPHLLGAIRALNDARNSLAHSVDAPELQESLAKFVTEVGYMRERKVSWPATLAEQLDALHDAFDDAASTILLLPQRL